MVCEREAIKERSRSTKALYGKDSLLKILFWAIALLLVVCVGGLRSGILVSVEGKQTGNCLS